MQHFLVRLMHIGDHCCSCGGRLRHSSSTQFAPIPTPASHAAAATAASALDHCLLSVSTAAACAAACSHTLLPPRRLAARLRCQAALNPAAPVAGAWNSSRAACSRSSQVAPSKTAGCLYDCTASRFRCSVKTCRLTSSVMMTSLLMAAVVL